MNYDTTEKIDEALQGIMESDSDSAIKKLNYILDNIPNTYSDLINQAFKYKRIPKEYLLSSILFTISTSIGLTFYMKSLGYKNYGNCYFTIIGSRGDAKSEAIKIATKPIKITDDKDYQNFKTELSISTNEEIKPIRKQILIQNATIEAAQKIHAENPNAVGIAIDEIFALIEKMANPNSRDGIAWRNFFLEGYTNGYIDVSRKTTESFRINETYPTLIGGLQHQFVPKLFANGNLESGFIDRQFFTPKLTSNIKLFSGRIDPKVENNYSKAIENIIAYKKQSESPEEAIKQFEIALDKEADDRIFIYTQKLINRQSRAPSIIKEYMSKMQISIQKLCVILFIMEHAPKREFASKMSIKTVELAIELNEFYFINFKQIIENNKNLKEDTSLTTDAIIRLAKTNNASRKSVIEITGLNKSTISRKWNKP
ncbi:DUF3987 domain-containing protein [Winogradskyella sp. PC D3.3]